MMATATNEYMKDGVLYRNDMRVGEDGLNYRERGYKKEIGPNALVMRMSFLVY